MRLVGPVLFVAFAEAFTAKPLFASSNNRILPVRGMADAPSSATPTATTAESDEAAASLISVEFERRSEYPTPDRPYNDLMIRAALGEQVERTPIWLFRQAGRHLPEYHAYKEKTNMNFLEFISDHEHSSECVMMPLRRYELDAAILFSDILTLAEALDVRMYMGNGFSLHLPNEIVTPQEMYHRVKRPEEITYDFVRNRLGYVMNCIVETRSKMEREQFEIPLIGFAGAPYTIMYYMLGGTSKKNNEIGMRWLKENEEASIDLLKSITKLVVEYLSMQVEAGAHMLQLFEAMGMMIDEEMFMKFALPCHEIIATELKARYPDIPLMVFARGASFANEALSELGYDVVTLDGSTDRSLVRGIVGDKCVQGDLPTSVLIREEGGTEEGVKDAAKKLLDELGTQKIIANLGEGLCGKEDPALVKLLVDTIHDESEDMINSAA